MKIAKTVQLAGVLKAIRLLQEIEDGPSCDAIRVSIVALRQTAGVINDSINIDGGWVRPLKPQSESKILPPPPEEEDPGWTDLECTCDKYDWEEDECPFHRQECAWRI